MAVNTWSSAGSTDGSVAGNWSLGAFADTDTLTFDATSTVDCTFSSTVDCAGFDMKTGYTGAFSLGGQSITTSGATTINSGGTFNGGGTWILDADANFTFTAATSWTTSAMNVTLFGTTTMSNNSGGTRTLHSINVAASGKTVVFAGTHSWSVTGDWITSSGTLTINQTFEWYANAGHAWTNSASTFNGTGSISLYANAAAVFTIPAYVYSGSGTIDAFNVTSAGASGFTLGGNIQSTRSIEFAKYAAADFTFDTAGYDITITNNNYRLRLGAILNNAGTAMSYLRDSTISIGQIVVHNGAAHTIDTGTADITITGGLCTFGSNTTIANGSTCSITFGSACTLTSAGETLGTIIFNYDGQVLTLDDPLACGNLTITQGGIDLNEKALTCGNFAFNTTLGGTCTIDAVLSCANFTINSLNAVTITANPVISGNMTLRSFANITDTGITYTFTGTPTISTAGRTMPTLYLQGNTTFAANTSGIYGRIQADSGVQITWGASESYEISTYTAGDLNGTTWVSSSPGATYMIILANGTAISNLTATDCESEKIINAATGGTNSGNNTNVWFTTVGHESTYEFTAASDSGGEYNVTVYDEYGQTTGSAGTLTVVVAPSITSVSPDIAKPAGGQSVEINGTFEDHANTTVDYGGTAATVTAHTANKITITTPAHAAGAIIITVTDSYGQSDTVPFTVVSDARRRQMAVGIYVGP